MIERIGSLSFSSTGSISQLLNQWLHKCLQLRWMRMLALGHCLDDFELFLRYHSTIVKGMKSVGSNLECLVYDLCNGDNLQNSRLPKVCKCDPY